MALKTNLGVSGRSESIVSPNTVLWSLCSTRSEIEVNGSARPPRAAGISTRVPASLRTGAATSSSKFVATPASSKVSRRQPIARTPAMIDPPDTLE